MAHELYENDNMISVKEKPWHGLGIVLDEHPTAKEAQKLAGLEWTVRKEQVYYRQPKIDGMSRIMKVPSAYAIVRNDNHMPLGMVGENYQPFQNNDMFQFMEHFCEATNAKIETAGSLRNGRIVWALSTNGTLEYVAGDPVDQYFLFKNSFDGSTNIEICFTTVRVVCNNTLTAALRGAKNIWRIRHTNSLHEQVEFAKQTLLAQHKYADELDAVMKKLASMPVTEKEATLTIKEILRKEIKDVQAMLEENEQELALAEAEEALTKHQQKTLDKILELHETGAGSDIPGVRGTLYGLLQSCTEYADHYKTIRAGDRPFAEARFESLMMGSAHDFKARAFQNIYSLIDA